MAELNECRACGAPIRWAITEANGRFIPLDDQPDPAGNVVETARYKNNVPIVRVLGHPELDAPGTLWMPHHATCPNWKGKKP